jgi:XapX domain-containing protein
MSGETSGQAISPVNGSEKPREQFGHPVAKSSLTKLAAWTNDRNIPFLITSLGMIVMLLWAGSYKMTAPFGLLYATLRVKSPASPLIALLGLLGMVLGEEAYPWLLTVVHLK